MQVRMVDAGMNTIRMLLSQTERRRHGVVVDYLKEAGTLRAETQFMIEIRGRIPNIASFEDDLP